MFDCHHLFGTFIASHKVRWEKWIAKREEKYRQFNAAIYCRVYYGVHTREYRGGETMQLLFRVKSTQYKKLAPNALRFTHMYKI